MGMDNSSFTANQSSGLEAASTHLQKASIVIYCVIFIVGTLGNGVVIYVTGFKMKKTVNSVWFLNLAVADFLFTTFLIFYIISLSQSLQWPFGAFMCKLNNFVSVVNMFASIFTLTAMSLDRCLSIWMVVWAHNKRTICKAQLISAGIWVIAGVCSTPYATFRTVSESNGERHCGYSMPHEQKLSLHIFRFVMGFVIPFLVIVVSYVAIGIRAMSAPRTRKRRSRRIISAIIFAFFICWLPFHVFNFIELKANNPDLKDIVRTIGSLIVSLAFLNSCLNPILYVFMCEEFQKKLRQSICFVLESALAEDHLSFASTRSMSSRFSKTSRSSDAAATLERIDAAIYENIPESKVVITEETPVSEDREKGKTQQRVTVWT
ncbi:C3a anaphylatoxin chemotactic receptor-like [Archocentrus centrarchus]|uniref:C3a anaphylatoxin chemotactic receptor-like n=1 Tax=Archocentrus centrarchus TaxID=63155 RepID=UPI0011E9EFB0|nr:C3a anaphylatoxin chemotactic receptor-like [Archocentrus centrarchus]